MQPHVEVVHEGQETPSTALLVLHGIYGRGANWRSFARKICRQRPDLAVLLPDLRMHGKSQSAQAPHTLESCAQDILSLLDKQARLGVVVLAIAGHSFGGKVALEMRRLRPNLPPVILIDSSPSPRPNAMSASGDAGNTVVAVLRLLQSLPERFASKLDYTCAIEVGGFPQLGSWLAMNLEPVNGEFRSTLDPQAMQSLLTDYFQRDLWEVVESPTGVIVVFQATQGSAMTKEDTTRVHAASSGPAPNTISLVTLHKIEGSHWLHVDALPRLVELTLDVLR